MADRVDIELRDYRDAHGTYDAVVSVEMIEAVGERYWPTFFATLDRCRTRRQGRPPGDRAQHDRMVATRDQYTWITKYIFPGGALPSVAGDQRERARRHQAAHRPSGFAFGSDYAKTLRSWRERFDPHADEVDALGFDTRFRRMWDFYLAYCEAGFATGYLDVEQLAPAKRGRDDEPTCRPSPSSSPTHRAVSWARRSRCASAPGTAARPPVLTVRWR